MAHGPNFPAFPHDERHDRPGMTLRDWFAGQALAGIMANKVTMPCKEVYDACAELAYIMADAMLTERARSIEE